MSSLFSAPKATKPTRISPRAIPKEIDTSVLAEEQDKRKRLQALAGRQGTILEPFDSRRARVLGRTGNV
ncbi:MAG TPA: hypothetical protein ENH94_03145 [Phycisphaerales bacterium]|nr:hypothetical protein [Phycisphaerales bacterium]